MRARELPSEKGRYHSHIAHVCKLIVTNTCTHRTFMAARIYTHKYFSHSHTYACSDMDTLNHPHVHNM